MFQETLTIITQIMGILTGLSVIIGRKKFVNLLIKIGKSDTMHYSYRGIIIFTLAVCLLLGFLVGTLKVLQGSVLIGFVAFGSIATASILSAYFNWKLSSRN